jgi:hypothetical protein
MVTKWCTVAPILYSRFDESLEFPFVFENGVILAEVPAWIKEKHITENLSFSHREQLINDIKYVLLKEYEASSLGDPDLDWRGEELRSKQDIAQESIQFCNVAMWLARPSAFGFELLISAEQRADTWTWRQLIVQPRLIHHEKHIGVGIAKVDLEVAYELTTAISALPRKGAVWTAVRILWKALLERTWEVRYLLFWVVLEALFGPEDARETTYRMSQRIAFFLATEEESAKELYKYTKGGYGWRSKVVHGMRLSKLGVEESAKVMLEVEELGRRGIVQILRDPNLIPIFNGRSREGYLDDQAFSS